MRYRKVTLDERGRAYVLEHLRDVNALCDSLYRVPQHESGHTFTIFPEEAPDRYPYEFSTGGLMASAQSGISTPPHSSRAGYLVPIPTLIQQRARTIFAALHRTSGSICICDDYNPVWPHEAQGTSRGAFGVGPQTYHLLCEGDGEDAIAVTLKAADTIWHGVSAVCAANLRMEASRCVTLDALAACSATATQITCTAYDGEGFVYWERLAG